jgi:predicted permease
MDRFYQDLRFALRTLVRRRGFSIIAIATLAIGVGITTAIFSVVNGILLRPLPFNHADRIIYVWEGSADRPQTAGEHGNMSYLTMMDAARQVPSIEAIADYTAGTATLTGEGPATIIPQTDATSDFFRVMGVQMQLGRSYTAEEDRYKGPKVAVVSNDFWKTHLGGKAAAIGSSIKLGGDNYEIVGVTPAGFDYPQHTQIWKPAQVDAEHCGRGCSFMESLARLAPGATVEQARKELGIFGKNIAKAYPKSNTGVTVRATSMQDSITGEVKPALYVLLGAVAMVLLIACANVANLLLVRGAARKSELAVRSVLGASRKRILAQLMTENLLIAAAAGVLGLGLASWGVDALRTLAPASIPRTNEVGLDFATTTFAIVLVAITALLFGLAPALQISRDSLSNSIRESDTRGGGGPRTFTRSSILVAEVALSIMLLLGAGLLLRSFAQLTSVDLGFDAQHVSTFTIGLPNAKYATPDSHVLALNTIADRLRGVPGVKSVGQIVGLPLGDMNFRTTVERKDKPKPAPGKELVATIRVADPGYFKTMSIPVIKGRDFTDADRHDGAQVALVSAAAVREFYKGEDVIGKPLHVGLGLGYSNKGVVRTIVGVVRDTKSYDLTDEPEPAVYVPAAQMGNDFMTYVIRSDGASRDVLKAARAIVQSFDPDIAPEYDKPMQSLVDAKLAAPRFYLALVGLFAVLAAILAAVGIYGVVSFLVANRTREIGIRIALGAQRDRVVKLVVWQGMKPALIGVAIGLAGAFASVKVMGSLLFGVTPHDIITYMSATVLLVAIVIIACAVPAYRASRIAPGVALRSD